MALTEVGDVTNFLAKRWGVMGVGAGAGLLAALLQAAGNPGNMGLCVVCFERDLAGALGLHRAAVVQYLRPEILGLILGAWLAALLFREFRPRSGSAPLLRFILGMLAGVGALIFLGCPWRALLRLAGGDGQALFGLAGLAAGVFIGTRFLKAGFNLGRTQAAPVAAGWVLPVVALGLLALRLLFPPLEGQAQSGVLLYSLKGPGASHAPLLVSLAAGLAIGFLAQRSRFCTVGAIRDLILFKSGHLFGGVVAFAGAAWLANLALGQFHPGFVKQPVAHSAWLWNFAGMVLAGWAFTLAGGCPGRQLFLSGEGDADAGLFVLGLLAGTALAHNFGLASSPDGPGPNALAGLIVGLAALLALGFSRVQGEEV